MIIAVDFDGVLHNPADREPGYKMGKPIEGAAEAMRMLEADEHYLVVHTVRGDYPAHVIQWLNHFDIPFNEVTRVKPAADVYIDDRAIRFVHWDDTLEQLERWNA